MANLFQRFKTLVNSWPGDVSKEGRDFTHYLRRTLLQAFKDGESTKIDSEYWELRIAALERIREDVHLKENKIEYKTATGRSLEECKDLVSDVKIINEARNMNIKKKLKALDDEKLSPKKIS